MGVFVNQSFIASFSGTVVEVLETVAIAYALIRAGFVREAVAASLLGFVLTGLAGLLLWPVHELFPIRWLRLAAGILLCGMGLQWTQKSLRRIISHKRPGWVDNPLREFAVAPDQPRPASFSILVFATMTKSAFIEGLEVLVVAFPIAAATGAWGQVSAGVLAGIASVLLATVALHGQLKKVPEVYVKLAIGVLLTAIGVAFLSQTL